MASLVTANSLPVLQPIPPQTVYPEREFVYRIRALDEDGTVPALRMLNAPAEAAFTDNGDGTRTFSWRPAANLREQTVIIFQAIDAEDAGLISTQRMILNRGLLSELNHSASASQVDAASQEDASNLSDATNQEDAGSPQEIGSPQDATEASDQLAQLDRENSSEGGASVQGRLPPSLPIIAEQSLTVGERFQLFIRPTAADNSVPGVFAQSLPDGATFDDAFNGSRLFQWQPSEEQVGEFVLRLIAFDAEDESLRTQRDVVLRVDGGNGNAAVIIADDEPDNTDNTDASPGIISFRDSEPYFEDISTQIVSAGQVVTFRVVPRMPDQSAAILHVDRLPDNASFDDNLDGTRTFYWQTANNSQGEHVFRFTAIHHRNLNERVSKDVLIVVGDPAAPGSQPDSLSSDNAQPSVPPPPPSNDRVRPDDRAEAFRFLQRASFGPTDTAVTELMGQTYSAWLDRQMSMPQTRYLDRVDAILRDNGLQNITDGRRQFDRQQIRSDAFWDLTVNASDQLRQRVAFALSQILVVSDRDAGLDNRVRGIAAYHDMLAEEAFGNYRNLLGRVTLNPMMGDFLSMRRNEKPDPENNIQSDENYAREMMQLFTLGLNLLQMNGEAVFDNNGQAVPAYTQEDVVNLARVFTGWNYGDANSMRSSERTLDSEIIPMRSFEEFHDKDEKQLVGNIKVPAGLSAKEELDLALDAVFNHPNVPPFVSKRLIQRLVTSNPTPAYIERVATVFADNGQGVRGDLAAVVRSILLDDEALTGHKLRPDVFGKLKEPVIKVASIWRAFDARGQYGKLRYSGVYADFLQSPYSAPSVFNFYSAKYRPPGEIGKRNLFAPEAQILNDTTVLRAADRLFDYAHAVPLGNASNSNQHSIELNIEFEKSLANDVPKLLEHLNNKLLAGSMSEALYNTLLELGESTPMTDNGAQRVREVLYVLFISPEFAVQS